MGCESSIGAAPKKNVLLKDWLRERGIELPKEKEYVKIDATTDGYIFGYNHARREIGNIEINL